MKTLLQITLYLAIPVKNSVEAIREIRQEQIFLNEEPAYRYTNSQNYSLSPENQLVVKPAHLIIDLNEISSKF